MRIIKGLEEIMPKWVKKIKKRQTLKQLGKSCKIDDIILNIEMSHNCMVGEAHFFDSSYASLASNDHCTTCERFAMTFFRQTTYDSSTKKEFKESQTEFLTHFKKEHKDLLKVHRQWNKNSI